MNKINVHNVKKLIGPMVLIFLLSCKHKEITFGVNAQNPVNATIREIQIQPDQYHEMMVETLGYFNYTFENVAIYPDISSQPDEAIWIDFDSELNKTINDYNLEKLQGRKLKVHGKFDKNQTGHLGIFIGTITVKFIETIE